MQNRSLDGRTYHDKWEDEYSYGREEWVAAHAALAYFTKWIMAQGAFATSDAQIDIALDDQDREFTKVGPWTTDEPAADDQFAWHNVYTLGGHPKPASEGHLKTGQS